MSVNCKVHIINKGTSEACSNKVEIILGAPLEVAIFVSYFGTSLCWG